MDNPNRQQLTLIEVLIFTTAIGIAFGVNSIADQFDRGVASGVSLAICIVIGSFFGAGIAILLFGRTHARTGAVVGGIGVPFLLLVIVAIVLYSCNLIQLNGPLNCQSVWIATTE